MTDSEIQSAILDMGRRARAAAYALAKLTIEQKNAILIAMADEIMARQDAILAANAFDLARAEENGLSKAMLDRLTLDPKRLKAIAEAVREVALLPDPVGEKLAEWTRPNGLRIRKVRVPIGVIGIIFESRPNVTTDAASLCFKTGNATILRGGSEAIDSNRALAAALQAGGERAGLPPDSIQLIPFTDRSSVEHMAKMDQYLDLISPRGGKGLVEKVVSTARMPVIKHYDGICHVFVDRDADPRMALDIALNAKCQRPGVCNAMETLLVHRDIAAEFFQLAAEEFSKNQVELVADPTAHQILFALGYPKLREADESSFRTEWLDLILSLRIVENLADAIDHIETFGSHHSDAIVTNDEAAAQEFLASVDSATVYWNASTRFTDGGEFGFGAEIGISTDKLHARGPMGLEELTTYKYLIRGQGQIRK